MQQLGDVRRASRIIFARSLAAVGLFLEIDIGEGRPSRSLTTKQAGIPSIHQVREIGGKGWHGQIIGRSGSQKKPRHRVPRLKRFDESPAKSFKHLIGFRRDRREQAV